VIVTCPFSVHDEIELVKLAAEAYSDTEPLLSRSVSVSSPYFGGRGTSSMVRCVGVLSRCVLIMCQPEVAGSSCERSCRLKRRCTRELTGPVYVFLCVFGRVYVCLSVSEYGFNRCLWFCVLCMYMRRHVRGRGTAREKQHLQLLWSQKEGHATIYLRVCVHMDKDIETSPTQTCKRASTRHLKLINVFFRYMS
jgi:hypothetical protein